MSNNTEDLAIIARFIDGDEQAFDELVNRYKPRVFNLCMKMLGHYEEAVDVSQDIFIKLYDSVKMYRKEARFSTYVYRVCVNFCKNRLRALARRKKYQQVSLEKPIVTPKGDIQREYAADGPSPRDNAISREHQEIVREAIGRLSAEYKEVIILREIEQLRYEEIAHVLRIDLGTVKSRLNRARYTLKTLLEGKV